MNIVHEIIDNEFCIEIIVSAEETDLINEWVILQDQVDIMGYKFNLSIVKKLPNEEDEDAFDQE